MLLVMLSCGQMIALILMLIDIGYVSARCIAISIINLIESLRYNVIIVTSGFTAYACTGQSKDCLWSKEYKCPECSGNNNDFV